MSEKSTTQHSDSDRSYVLKCTHVFRLCMFIYRNVTKRLHIYTVTSTNLCRARPTQYKSICDLICSIEILPNNAILFIVYRFLFSFSFYKMVKKVIGEMFL